MSSSGSDGVAAASDDRSRDADELQFTTGEGPCHEAFANRRPVLTADLRSLPRGRWPGYTDAALSSGIGAMFAFPCIWELSGSACLTCTPTGRAR